MATYFDGEKLKNVTAIEGSQSSGVDIYECPANRYAVIDVNFAEAGTYRFFESDGATLIGDLVLGSSIDWNTTQKQWVLSAGQKIFNQSGSGVTVHWTIREFLKP